MPTPSPKLLQNTRKYLKYLNFSFGMFLTAFGSFLLIHSNDLVNQMIDRNLQLRPDSEILKKWLKPDINITLDFYLFNWTNPEDFQKLAVKPKFQQLGPYSFIEVPNKRIVKWNDGNRTLDYNKEHWYYFNSSRSARSLEDKVVSINALLVTAASKSKYYSIMQKTFINMALLVNRNLITWKRTAEEFLFKGFDDKIVNFLNSLPTYLLDSLDLLLPIDKIGYIYGRNGSSTLWGTHTIGTGIDSMENYGQMKLWNGKNYTEHLAPQCAQIRGSAGEFQLTKLQKYQPVEYFSVDLCRSIYFQYLDEVHVDGVPGYLYKLSDKVFDNGTLNVENKCYCNGECLPSGAVNISSCWFGMPLFVSQPHFFNADNYFLSQIEGLQPNGSLHESYIILEPRTGFILELKGRLQLNIYLEPSSHLSCYQNGRRLLFPVLWMDVYARTSQDSINRLKMMSNLNAYFNIIGICLISFAMFALSWSPIRNWWLKRYAQHMQITNIDGDDADDALHDDDLINKEALLRDSSHFPGLYFNPRKR